MKNSNKNLAYKMRSSFLVHNYYVSIEKEFIKNIKVQIFGLQRRYWFCQENNWPLIISS